VHYLLLILLLCTMLELTGYNFVVPGPGANPERFCYPAKSWRCHVEILSA
jgi:hypothetical protein